MQLSIAKTIIEQRERAAAEKAASGAEEEEEVFEVWDDEDFEQALKLIRQLSFTMQETSRLVPMHPHRRTALETLAQNGMEFLCLFEGGGEDDSTGSDLCKECGSTPFTGNCNGSCLELFTTT